MQVSHSRWVSGKIHALVHQFLFLRCENKIHWVVDSRIIFEHWGSEWVAIPHNAGRANRVALRSHRSCRISALHATWVVCSLNVSPSENIPPCPMKNGEFRSFRRAVVCWLWRQVFFDVSPCLHHSNSCTIVFILTSGTIDMQDRPFQAISHLLHKSLICKFTKRLLLPLDTWT